MATFKPAYLIHGDDHGRIGERRAGLRALAERESGAGGVESLEGEAASPVAVANTLSAMTFAIGRRFIVVDGAERWKEADVKAHIVPALAAIAPDTTIAFFAREEGAGARIGLDEVEQAAAHSSLRQVWGLVDAVVAGDAEAATRTYLTLEAQGESVGRLVGLLASRVRGVLEIATRLEAGESA